MAYVDHAFSITDEDLMVETSYAVNNKPPIKEIALAISLLVFGVAGIVLGIFMTYNSVGGDRAHGNFNFFLLFFYSFCLSFFFLFCF
ncbi:hypothetical protein POPTR_006G072000v4 [Populus trichocarpa]|jgi:hypothetical protein|uniref:Uncharacterized protein n=1 Tax=Populus trichocarpa TaxID=3694 RepID=A0ACC0STK8_POPTR|nr:hypothetical protein BDE02_06G062000 [Populus trichocarpa]KAI9392299.1 hypothetical protein POPTR_006G072000v4 [Populus trichocarpa]